MTDTNPRAVIGDNAPSPFDISKEEIEGFYDEAKNWLDGTEIETVEQAATVSTLTNKLREAAAAAEERRVAEAKPYDDAKKAIQARYNPLLQKDKGKAPVAIKGLLALQTAWLNKQEAIRLAAAAEARAAADEADRIARAAAQAANPTNLDEIEVREALIREAQQARAAAARVEKSTSTAKGDVGRAISLRTFRRAEITDAKEFARYVWTHQREELDEFMLSIAQRRVDDGAGQLPGVAVHVERKAA